MKICGICAVLAVIMLTPVTSPSQREYSQAPAAWGVVSLTPGQPAHLALVNTAVSPLTARLLFIEYQEEILVLVLTEPGLPGNYTPEALHPVAFAKSGALPAMPVLARAAGSQSGWGCELYVQPLKPAGVTLIAGAPTPNTQYIERARLAAERAAVAAVSAQTAAQNAKVPVPRASAAASRAEAASARAEDAAAKVCAIY
jgi:hypothetical protein